MISILDLFFIIIILIFGIVALVKGFIDSLFGLGAPALSIIAGLCFKNKLVDSVGNFIKNEYLATGLSFLIIFLLVFIVIKIIQIIVKKIFDTEIFTSLNKFLGFIFGVLEGFAFVALILFLLKLQPWFDVTKLLQNSIFARLLEPIISMPAHSIIPAVEEGLQEIGSDV